MAWIGFVYCQDLKHVAVVFLEITSDTGGVPVRWRRTNRIVSGRFRVEWWRRVHVSRGVAAFELRHLDNLARIRVRQLQNVIVMDKLLNSRDGQLHVLHQVCWFAMVLRDFSEHQANNLTSARGIVWWKGLFREVMTPKLPSHDRHFALHPIEFRFRVA